MQFQSLSNHGLVMRPLISFRKKDLLLYARENGLKWREDVSNQTNDYLRNILRNQVIPAVELNLPDVRKRLKYSIGSLNSSAILLEHYRDLLWNDIAKQKENEIYNLYVSRYKNHHEIGTVKPEIVELVVGNYDKSIPEHRIALREYLG